MPGTTANGVINPGEEAAIHLTITGMYKCEPRMCLERVKPASTDAAPDWLRGTQDDDVYQVEAALRLTEGSGRRSGGGPAWRRGSGPSMPCRPPTTCAGVGHPPGSAAHPGGGDHPRGSHGMLPAGTTHWQR